MERAKKSLKLRLAGHSYKAESGCTLWTGCVSKKGYGKMSVMVNGKRTTVDVHRIAYMEYIGPIPDGLEVHHECRVRNCINPEHLRAITHRENTDYERNKTACDRGHPYVEGSYYEYKTKYGMGRWCKLCPNERYAERNGLPVETAGNNRKRLVCLRKGHPLTDDNVIVVHLKNGQVLRKCKQCFIDNTDKRNARRRELRAHKKVAAAEDPTATTNK